MNDLTDIEMAELIASMKAFCRRHTWNATYLGRKLNAFDSRIINFTAFYYRQEIPLVPGHQKMTLGAFLKKQKTFEKRYINAVKKAFRRIEKECL